MAHRNNLKRGFTLIELLVTVSIITLLVAILLPAIRQARRSAQSITCVSNARQVGMFLLTYANDSRDRYVHYTGDWPDVVAAPGNPIPLWPEALQRLYVPRIKVTGTSAPHFSTESWEKFLCPEGDRDWLAAQPTTDGLIWPRTIARRTHYGYNVSHIGSSARYTNPVFDASLLPNYGPSALLTEVRRPGATYLLTDTRITGVTAPGNPPAGHVTGFYAVPDTLTATVADYIGRPDARHVGNSVNVLFDDLHAESIVCSDPQNPYLTLGYVVGNGHPMVEYRMGGALNRWDRY